MATPRASTYNAESGGAIYAGVPSTVRLAAGDAVIVDGNSLAATSGLQFPPNGALWRHLSGLDGSGITALSSVGITAQSVAVGGQTTEQMLSSASDVTALFAVGHTTLLIPWELRNSAFYSTASATPAQDAVDAMWDYCAAMRAAATSAGTTLKIVLPGTIPTYGARNGQTGTQGEIDAFNALLLEIDALVSAQWSAHVDRYVDLRAGTVFGEFTDWTLDSFVAAGVYSGTVVNGPDYPDYIHLITYLVPALSIASVLTN